MTVDEVAVNLVRRTHAHFSEDWKRVLHMNLVPMRWWHSIMIPAAAFLAPTPHGLWLLFLYTPSLHQPHVHTALRLLPVTPRQYGWYLYSRFVFGPPLLALLFMPLGTLFWMWDKARHLLPHETFWYVLKDATLMPLVALVGLSLTMALVLWAERRQSPGVRPFKLLHAPIAAFVLACYPIFEHEPWWPYRWSELNGVHLAVLAAVACIGLAGFLWRETLLLPLMHTPPRRGTFTGALSQPMGTAESSLKGRFRSWQQVFTEAFLKVAGMQVAFLLLLLFLALPAKFQILAPLAVHVVLLDRCQKSLPSLRLLPLGERQLLSGVMLAWALSLLPTLGFGLLFASQGHPLLLVNALAYLSITPGSLALYLSFPNRYVFLGSVLLALFWTVIVSLAGINAFLILLTLAAFLPGIVVLRTAIRDLTPRFARLMEQGVV